ncbi:MAG: hypothetical protein CFE21_10670 [Bacteroidetes bacterium B1(2017)]|nr:MAG: hypothetical protein CFE21_10670 [Bacteroidetes bacterium B1(2017)]
MRKTRFLLFFCLLSRLSLAQMSSWPDPKVLAQFSFRSEEVMRWEAGLIYLGKHHLNFQLKASVHKNYEYLIQRSYLYTNYSTIGGVSFVSDFSYIKPGFIFLRKEKKTRSFYLSLNGVLAISKNRLNVNYLDPILGPTYLIEKEDKVYKGLELEAKFNYDITRFAAVNFGLTLGDSHDEEKLFKEVFNGAFKGRDNAIPGMGINSYPYFILSTGLLLKLY